MTIDFEQKKQQWIKDIDLLAEICRKRLIETRPGRVGDEQDEELVELYLIRDNADPRQLIKDFPNHKTSIELLSVKTAPGILSVDSKSITTDNELRISLDDSLWGTFSTLQWNWTLPPDERLQAEFNNLPVKLAEGKILINFPAFIRERFKELININVPERENPFQKIVTVNYRPVMLSDLWDARELIRNDDLENMTSERDGIQWSKGTYSKTAIGKVALNNPGYKDDKEYRKCINRAIENGENPVKASSAKRKYYVNLYWLKTKRPEKSIDALIRELNGT